MSVINTLNSGPSRERRRFPRVPLRSKAAVYPAESSIPLDANMRVADISENGLSLEGMAQLAVGQCYRLELALPNGISLRSLTRIVWKEPNPYIQSYGAKLERIDPGEKRKLQKILRRQLGLPEPKSSWAKWIIWTSVSVILIASITCWRSLGGPVLILGAAMALLYILTFRPTNPT